MVYHDPTFVLSIELNKGLNRAHTHSFRVRRQRIFILVPVIYRIVKQQIGDIKIKLRLNIQIAQTAADAFIFKHGQSICKRFIFQHLPAGGRIKRRSMVKSEQAANTSRGSLRSQKSAFGVFFLHKLYHSFVEFGTPKTVY